jgi:sec-independent protein translocase protein TatA
MFGLGWQELVIVLVIIMIIFGAGKLPEVAKSLGQGVKEFKQEANTPVDSLAAASATGADGIDGAGTAADRSKVRADEI